MKRTVLDMTQSILSSMDAEEVNSISDTPESMQVANILKNTFYNMISRMKFPQHEKLFQLEASGDVTRPTLMYVPEGIGRIHWLKYWSDQDQMYIDVTVLNTSDFLDITAGFNVNETDVESFTFTAGSSPQTFTFYYKNDKQPQYCTVLSERYVLFDGFDATFDSTLQGSKTQVFGETIPVFLLEDDFIPDIDEEAFSLLLNEAKSLAFFELKQVAHPKAEQESRRQWSSNQKRKSVINRPNDFDALPDFGKRSYNGISFFRAMGWRR